MKQFLIDIKNRLNEIESVKYVQIFNNQIDRLESGDSISFALPAVFIEVTPQSIEQAGRYDEVYNLQVNIHILHEFYNGSNFDENLDVFDVKQEVYKSLKNFQGTGGSSWTRVNEIQDFDHNQLYHFIQTYQTTYVDIDAEPATIEHKANLSITKTIETSL